MSEFLTQHHDDEGGPAAQTGNLVHSAVAVYHRIPGSPDERKGAGLAGLHAALPLFPKGDATKAARIFGKYADDPENQNAVVPWVEQPVRLELDPAPWDPTQEKIVIEGTLDQIREIDARHRVYDLKTGERMTAAESIDEHQIQQAAYVLAARHTLVRDVEPGFLIYTPAYFGRKGKVFLDLKLDVEGCRILMNSVAVAVAAVRAGMPVFKPSQETCKWCPVKSWPGCLSTLKGVYG